MSNLIPPLLSSTPPPIVGPLDEEDDDEFGDFRAAADSYDCDDFSLPSSPQKSPEKELKTDPFKVSLDINSNKSQKDRSTTENGSINELEKDFQDRRKSCEIEVISSNQSEMSKTFDIQEGIDHDDLQILSDQNLDKTVSKIDDQTSECNDIEVIHSVASNLKNSDENDFDCNLQVDENLFDGFSESAADKTNSDDLSVFNEINEIKTDCLDEINSEITDKEEKFDKSSKDINYDNPSESSVSLKVSESDPKLSEDEFGDFENHFPPESNDKLEESDEEFDGFVDAEPPVTQEDPLDDDFGDFESSEFGDFSSQRPDFMDINEKNALERSEAVLLEIFPKLESDIEYIDETKENTVFDELRDITETNALIYQWSKSNSQKMFLKALNIDTRNILYGPAWSSSMPRFAANLGLTPLEPVKTEILTPTPVQNVSSPSISSQKSSDIPTAQFDWTGSGLINPLDSTSIEPAASLPEDSPQPQIATILPPTSEKTDSFSSLFEADTVAKLSKESPSLPEMENKSELPKPPDDFAPFQSPKLIPLRETYITTDLSDLGKPGWLQPTILTPDLPRKEPILNTDDDDEFDDFQMVLPEEKSVENEPQTLPKLDSIQFDSKSMYKDPQNQEHIFENFISSPIDATVQKQTEEEEFTEFHSSKAPSEILTPLQPVPLQPLQPSIQYSQPAQINWPNPGVSEEEIRNIELCFLRKTEPKVEVPKVRKEKSVDDEEWSDFVSVPNPVKPVLPERTATPDLPLSVLNLNHVQAPRQPIPVITPSGLVQTKLASNVSKSVVQTTIQPTTLRPPTTQFHPSIISNHFAANFPSVNDEEDDDWSEFVSSEPHPQTNGYQQKPATNQKNQVNWNSATTNIIMNPTHFASLPNYGPGQSKKAAIPSISALPDLDFIAPRNRTNKK